MRPFLSELFACGLALLLLSPASARAAAPDFLVSAEAPAPAAAPAAGDTASLPLSRYERHRRAAMRLWSRLIPTQATLHFAGSIGVLSAGAGWHYGRRDAFETEMLVGFLPRWHAEAAHATFTLKQRFVPWHCRLSRRWTLEPLTAGFFFNTISGEDFWRHEPSRYPKHYYGFSTKVRSHVFLGQRVRFAIPRRHRLLHQAVSAYYEISSCDLYIASKATNHDFPWRETLSLSFGLRWEM